MGLTNEELLVLANIIAAAETGGYEYGAGDYADFTPPYANSKEEHGVTIGKYQYYATEAKNLLWKIQLTDPELFKKLDTVGLDSDLKVLNWEYYRIAKDSPTAKCIQKIISTDVGKKVQDEMAMEEMQTYAKKIERLGVTDHQAIAMAVNFQHQGGMGAVKRILEKTGKPYTLDRLYAACKTDTGNQVGAYKTRQKFVYEAIQKYWPVTKTEEKSEGISRTAKFTGEITASFLNIRTGPEITASNLKSYPVLKGGTKVEVCDEVINSEGNKWYFIRYNGKYGYASAKYIKKV